MLKNQPASLCLLLALLVSGAFGDDDDARKNATRFESHIRPVLAETCVACHGVKKQEGGLRLDSLAAMLKGGESGPAVVAGRPEASLLLSALRYDELEMPPENPLASDQIEQFARWIQQGAIWPDDVGRIRTATGQITEQDRQWWAFRPLAKIHPPVAAFTHSDSNEIDRFIHRRLALKQMQPAKRADRPTLVRRVYQTLIGLPPTPEQVDEFALNESPRAYEDLVDSLLADQRYGEHWSRFWLDLVRYAESDGWNADSYRPNAWRYRDYVVDAFNDDKPYPDFVREQLAGDELEEPTPESLAATGYLRLGIFEYNQRNSRQHWDDILNEITDVTGDVFLGLGMACARCHDHKYDPLLQVDYYKLRAFFEPIVFNDKMAYATLDEKDFFHRQNTLWLAKTQAIREKIDAIEKGYNDKKRKATIDKFPLDIQACYHKPAEERNSWEQQMVYFMDRQFYEEGKSALSSMKDADKATHESLLEQLKQFDAAKPKKLPTLMTATNYHGEFAETVVPTREEVTPPGFARVLSERVGPEYPDCGRKRRTSLANWITSPSNPLTTRVMVNRIWKQHFGRGLVRSVSDFGTLGGKPSHPELLDWLAEQFVDDGGRIKRLQKRILMSATWQQASVHSRGEDYASLDPENELLWRRDVTRLTAEQIRDAMLSASGELSLERGGPSVTSEFPRRSLYIKSFRNTPDRFLHAFDIANGLKSVGQRSSTTTPTQALMMINGEYVLGRAETMAKTLGRIANEEQRVREAIRRVWGREPTDEELEKSVAFVQNASTQESYEKLTDFCHLLLNSNEFLYVD